MSDFDPDWASPPGDTIKDLCDERNLALKDLAAGLGVDERAAAGLIMGTRAVNPDIAQRLVNFFGSTKLFWLRREAQYREALAQQEERKHEQTTPHDKHI